MIDYKELKHNLKSMDKKELKTLFLKADLEEIERWLVRYAYIEERLVLNTCAKLNISESTYHRMLPLALTKVYYTLKFS